MWEFTFTVGNKSPKHCWCISFVAKYRRRPASMCDLKWKTKKTFATECLLTVFLFKNSLFLGYFLDFLNCWQSFYYFFIFWGHFLIYSLVLTSFFKFKHTFSIFATILLVVSYIFQYFLILFQLLEHFLNF